MPAKKQARSLVTVLKNLYQTMLVEFGVEKTLDSLRVAARDLSLVHFVAKTWQGKGYLPTEHTYILLNELQKNCLSIGQPFEPFFQNALLNDHYGSFLDSTEAFSLTNQVLWKLFHVNLLQCLFEHLESLNTYLNPGNYLVPIKFTKGRRNETCSMIAYFDMNLDVCLSGSVVGIIFSTVPHWFNYSMRTTYCILAERRSVKDQLDFYKSCGLFIDKEQDLIPVKTMDFTSFCAMKGIPYPKHLVPERTSVVEIPQTDIFDLSNRYVVLHKNVAYNAPGILCEITYPCKPANSEMNLKKAEQKLSHDTSDFFKIAMKLHQKTMAIIQHGVCIEYCPQQGELFYNGASIARGKPGHILAVLTNGWCSEKKTEFKNIDFYKNPAIRSDKYDKSFNIGIQRALKIVQNKMPLFTIERRTGSASIFFACQVDVTFRTRTTE